MLFPCGVKEVFHRFSSDLTVHRLIAGAVVVKDLRAEALFSIKIWGYLFGFRDRVACCIVQNEYLHNLYIISVHTYKYNYIYYKFNNVDRIFIFEYRFQCTK